MLNEKTKQKLDAKKPEDLKEKTQIEIINLWKIHRGEDAETNFRYEYDFLLDEEEDTTGIDLNEMRETIPTIFNRIELMSGDQMVNGIKTFISHITNKDKYENKLQKITDSPRLSQEQKDEQINIRKEMRKEYLALVKKEGKFNSYIAWKIWFIEDGNKAKNELLEKYSEDKVNEKVEQVIYLGKDFVDECKALLYEE